MDLFQLKQEKFYPFQYNVQKFIELKDIKDSEIMFLNLFLNFLL